MFVLINIFIITIDYMLKNQLYINLLFLIAAFSCSQNYQPKPKGLNQIYLPKPQYKVVTVSNNYSFERNNLASTNENKDLGWFNLSYFNQGAELLITYKKIKSQKHLKSLLDESYRLVSKHRKKATNITETNIKTNKNHNATIIDIKGEVPTPIQFVVTDSSDNFIRAALYFEKPIKGDSLTPVVNYIKLDILHLLNTLSWNE